MSTDVNRAMEHVRKLQKIWPDLYFQTQKETREDIRGPAKLITLHIVWSWSKDLMKTLAPSVFCDATFEVTVYHYKVVCISTLDGENQIRPLMCSFIINSTGPQWGTVFDIFGTHLI